MQYVTLNNGLSMPQLGYGVFKIPNDEATSAVTTALNLGYRSIDTAMIYQNERGVGEAIAKSNLPREELFITTKVWNGDQGYESTLKAFDKSLDELGLDYIDLYLIHWPTPKFDKYIETYKALEKLYKDGRVKAIGVSNFNLDHLERLLAECEVTPVLNQVECHPYLQQPELREFCEKHDIFLESWGPLHQGGDLLEDEMLKEIAMKYDKTSAQVVLRWHLQENSIIIPKSVTPSRMEENLNVFDFELSEEDMNNVRSMNRNERQGSDPADMHNI